MSRRKQAKPRSLKVEENETEDHQAGVGLTAAQTDPNCKLEDKAEDGDVLDCKKRPDEGEELEEEAVHSCDSCLQVFESLSDITEHKINQCQLTVSIEVNEKIPIDFSGGWNRPFMSYSVMFFAIIRNSCTEAFSEKNPVINLFMGIICAIFLRLVILAHTSKDSFVWLLSSMCPLRTSHHVNLNSQHNGKILDLIQHACTSEGTISLLSTLDRDTSLLAHKVLICSKKCSTGDCTTLIGKGVCCR
ncbi:hypothetical protein WISP_15135 [Willisornis vidua]|uniref:Zinc finger protein 521 n=1 Tax=Willisornis vidua TaxID=1566151 RepID=A0ABQ9DVT8_9PASS|nr:hypothetical protein WISP_15135 [Willisornis vidua]